MSKKHYVKQIIVCIHLNCYIFITFKIKSSPVFIKKNEIKCNTGNILGYLKLYSLNNFHYFKLCYVFALLLQKDHVQFLILFLF